MKNQAANKDILNALRSRIKKLIRGNIQEHSSNNEVTMLLNELGIYTLDLQTQNEELLSSYSVLETEHQKFARLFNVAPIGYLVLKQDGRIEDINQAAEVLLNETGMAPIGKKFQIFILKDSIQEYKAFIQKLQESPEHVQCEVMLKTGEKAEKYVQLNGIAIPSSGGVEAKQYITITDITYTKKAEQYLYTTTERLNEALKASLTGIWIVKSKGNNVFLDENCRNILNIEAANDVDNSKALTALIIDEDRPKLDSIFSNCDKDWEMDIELRLAKPAKKGKTILVKGKSIYSINGQNYLAGILTDISDRKRSLEMEEEQEKNQHRLLRRAAIEAEEKERARISTALHDSVCQILYGIRFNLNHLNSKELSRVKLEHINMMLDQAITELRTLSGELTPSILKDFGLKAGINDMVQQLSNAGFKVYTAIDDKADLLPGETQLYCFRIVQELLNNSIKHSGANEASVTINIHDDLVSIHVSDKGKGFQVEMEEALKKGSGLRGIKNRVSLLNGKMEIIKDNGIDFRISFRNS